jgi:hypothetical protein
MNFEKQLVLGNILLSTYISSLVRSHLLTFLVIKVWSFKMNFEKQLVLGNILLSTYISSLVRSHLLTF